MEIHILADGTNYKLDSLFKINKTSRGYWIKVNDIIIQYGSISAFGESGKTSETYFLVDLPIPFTSKDSYSSVASYWGQRNAIFQVENYNDKQIRVYIQLGICYLGSYIAIGY